MRGSINEKGREKLAEQLPKHAGSVCAAGNFTVVLCLPHTHAAFAQLLCLFTHTPQAVDEGAEAERQWVADLDAYAQKYPRELEEFKVHFRFLSFMSL